MEEKKPKFIVVIGVSAGGFFALAELVSQLNEQMDAAFLVVMHVSNQSAGYLVDQMQKFAPLRCIEAEDGAEIKKSTIYFAQPNKHLMIKNEQVKVACGPRENQWRPAINVLFRSAAAAYDGRTIGIILTGLPDDGTSGMSAIRRCGGTCIVQDPDEAEFPDMPLSVLKEMDVDYCIPLAEMGTMISDIISNKEITNTIIPTDILKEVQISESGIGSINKMEELGKPSVFTCPECGGVLFELTNDATIRFKCHTGHAYSVNELLSEQNKNLETSLWVALRSLEERKKLLSQLSEKNIARGSNRADADYAEKINELGMYAHQLKNVLSATQKEKDCF